MHKKPILLLLSLLLSLSFIIPSLISVKGDYWKGYALVFSSLSSDGKIYSELQSTYLDAHDATTGTVINTTGNLHVGQHYDELNDYWILRAFLFFDTSEIPDNATIETVELRLIGYGSLDYTDTEFNLTVQNGQPTYPHQPIESGDYAHGNYSGNGGTFYTGNWVNNSVNTLKFNAEGITWVNVEGTTKLCLRSSRDINAQAPTGNEHIRFWASEKAEKTPKLVVAFKTYVFSETEAEDLDPWTVPDDGEVSDIIEDVAETLGPPLSTYGLWLIIGAIVVLGAGGVYAQTSKRKVVRTPTGRLHRPRGPDGKYKKRRT